ncbi:hypothetical protein ACIQBJ_05665 [Kitasatospora sp. NPDC088391]|uniref:hypothetical protein n=1 Tax=Kitasatospora sp. NPDC088391 TaxID=3364074 RepID=UPI003804E2B3
MTPVLVFGLALLIALLTQWRQWSARRRAELGRETAPGAFDPEAYGLVRSAELDPGRAGPPMRLLRRKELEALTDSCLAGGWRAAAAYMTAAGRDWDERWARLDLLTRVAAERDEWLTRWRASGVEGAAAATVQARLLLRRAWEARGTGRAAEVPPDRRTAFRALLSAAREIAQQAAELDPDDPGPWVVLVTAARGAPLSRRRFRALWGEVTARAPQHAAGHGQALRYLGAEWHGSDRRMLRFAERAVRTAPDGSPLPGLYLQALYQLEQRHGPAGLPWARRRRALLPKVAEALAALPPTDDRLPSLRHLLAHFALLSGRPELALEQFRLIGPWCGAHPWTSMRDPVRGFDRARALAVSLTARTPGRSPGEPAGRVGGRSA